MGQAVQSLVDYDKRKPLKNLASQQRTPTPASSDDKITKAAAAAGAAMAAGFAPLLKGLTGGSSSSSSNGSSNGSSINDATTQSSEAICEKLKAIFSVAKTAVLVKGFSPSKNKERLRPLKVALDGACAEVVLMTKTFLLRSKW